MTVDAIDPVDWAEFAASDGDLAEHARRRLTRGICYLATVRPDGYPRVHPVGAHVRDGRLVVPMKPTSPKGADLRRDGRFALHCTVEDRQGGGGEILVTGVASEIEAPDDFARRGWIAFHLRVGEVLSVHYPERDDRPLVRRWSR